MMVRMGAGLFCLGAWWLQQQPALPGLGWVLVLAVALLIRWVAHDALGRTRPAMDLLLCLAVGFLWAAFIAQGRMAARLPQAWEGRDIEVQGVVAQMPHTSPRDMRFLFAIEHVRTPLAPALKQVQLSWHGAPGPVAAGERWRFTVRLKRPHGALNPYGFDRRYWSLERGIQAVGYVYARAPAVRAEELVWAPGYLLEHARQKLRDRIVRAAGGDGPGGVLVALAIGDQDAIDADLWRLFTRTGVGHLMSISGLHITMLSGLAALLAGMAWRRSAQLVARVPARVVGLCVGLAVGVAYAALSGFGVPAQRTVLMLAVTVAGLMTARQWPISHALAAALWVVVLIDPFCVMAAGFWLSFAAVALIAYVAQGRLRPPAAWAQWLRIQGALTVGLIPLSVLLFQQVSLISPVANAFAIPLVSLAVVPLTLAGMLMPFDFVLWSAERLMAGCLWLLAAMDRGDWVVWQQALPPVWTLAIGMGGVLWCLAPRGFPGRALGLLALLPGFVAAPAVPARGDLWVDVLDVGQGLAALVRTQRHSLLFDAGPEYSPEADAGDRVVLPHLRATGVAGLDGLIVSHDDRDHSGGADSVLRGTQVHWMASSLPSAHALHDLNPVSIRCAAGQRWEWDGVQFEFLHPPMSVHALSVLKDNDRSCVLRVKAPGGTLLMPGDIEARTERQLVQAGPDLKADVLIAPHHGSGTSSTTEFLQAVTPAAVIVTNGYRNRHGHPRAEVLGRYSALGARVWRSDRDGAVRVRFERHGWRAQSWRDVHARYWYD